MASERSPFIADFSDLYSTEVQDIEYANTEEAFFGPSIFQFVADEVHAILQMMCCSDVWDNSCCNVFRSFYNPIYCVMFLLLYILTFPGALLHWLMLDCVQVRKQENPEEREMRCQGLYTAIGIAIISIPFGIVGLFLGDATMLLINEIALAVNVMVILIGMIALKAIAKKKIVAIRVFTIGSCTVLLFLIGLALLDVYAYVTFLWITMLEYVLRLFEIFVYYVIAVNSIQFWSIYDESEVDHEDVYLALGLGVLYCGVVIGFVVAVSISVENAWRIMYW